MEQKSNSVKITPVILAGGSGTRLWPLSRKSYPKQFSKLTSNETLFQKSALRLMSSDIVSFSDHIILTNSDYRFIVVDQLREVGIDPASILIEPESKNSGPAILAASLYALKHDPNAILMVAPSDHVILDEQEFHKAINLSLNELRSNNIVTFGVKPDRPHTGYGYLEVAGELNNNLPKKIIRFVEKPNLENAQHMLNSNNCLWNSGIFIFKAIDMVNAFKSYLPSMVDPVKKAVAKGRKDLSFFRLETDAWKKCNNISIDYAVMEHASNLMVVPISVGWTDLGDWNAVWEEQGPDNNGISKTKNVTVKDCNNVLLRSESEDQHLVCIGLENIIAVSMPDAVLVSHKDRVQDVKQVLGDLKKNGVQQAETSVKDHRPWGWFETLARQGRFQVKRILVNPGASLSLQSHNHRSEHWIVVEGTIKVTVNEKTELLSEGQSVFVPLGAIHRMENPGKVPMVLIEVQTGAYLGEDDIIRYEDVYSRN